MAYEVLARKYRPQTFSEVVGQPHITDTLSRALEQDRVGHAYLFVGSRGTGKTTLARIFAKCLNCENGPTPTPCNTCPRCREITAGNALDMLEIDGASNNKVENVREIRENAKFGTANARFKIYLIDEVHMLSTGAFNALLKTLEEPPPHVKFLFATTEPQKIPDTILSRCQRFDLRRIRSRDITARLREICDTEQVEAEENALLAVARGARGGMRDALSALDQLISFRGKQLREEDVLAVFGLVSQRHLEELAAAILRHDPPGILRAIAEFDHTGKDLERVMLDLVIHLRQVLVQAYSPKGGLLDDLPDAQAEVIREQAGWIDPSRVSSLLEKLIAAAEQLKFSLSKRTLLETSLITAARTAHYATLDEVWKAVEALGGAAETPADEKKKLKIAEPPPPLPAEPPPCPTLLAPPPPDPAEALARLRTLWPDWVEHELPLSPTLRRDLRDSWPVELTDTTLMVGFDPEFPGELEEVRMLDHGALRQSISHRLGWPVKLDFCLLRQPVTWSRQSASPEGADSTTAPDLNPQTWIAKEAVRNILEVFHGKIVDIQPK